MTQDVNCVISLISIFVFHLSHHIAVLFLSCLGGKTPQKQSDTVKNTFSFVTLVPSCKTCNKLRRCTDVTATECDGGEEKTPLRPAVSLAKLKRRQRQITSVTDWRLKALKRDQFLHESREPPTHTILWPSLPYTHNHFSLSSSSSSPPFPTHLINTDTLKTTASSPRHSFFFFFFTIPARFQFRASAAASAQQTATSVQFHVSESLIHW